MFNFFKNIYDSVVNGPPCTVDEWNDMMKVEAERNKPNIKKYMDEKDIPSWVDDTHVFNCGWIDENSSLMKKVDKKDSGWLLLEVSPYDASGTKRTYHQKH